MAKPIPKRKAPPKPLRGQGRSGLKLFVLIQPNPSSRVGQCIHAEVLCKDFKQAKELFTKRLRRSPSSSQILDWSDCIGKWDHVRNLKPGVVRTLEDVLKAGRLHVS